MTNIKKAVVTLEPPPITPMQMLDRALAGGAAPETLAQFMALAERWDASQAKKAFDVAMADCKSELPVIVKTREVDFTTSRGRTNYKYEDFASIARAVDPVLARHGLNYRFRTASPAGEPVSVTCILTHREGHSEETSLSAGRDDSGNKNSIQAVGSTVAYLQRYTLKAALGLSAAADDDARGAGEQVEPLDADAITTLRDMLHAAGAPEGPFLKWAKADRFEDIPADYYDSCVEAIKQYKAPVKA